MQKDKSNTTPVGGGSTFSFLNDMNVGEGGNVTIGNITIGGTIPHNSHTNESQGQDKALEKSDDAQQVLKRLMSTITQKKETLTGEAKKPEIIMEGYGLALAMSRQLGLKGMGGEDNILKDMVKFFKDACYSSALSLSSWLVNTSTENLFDTLSTIQQELCDIRSEKFDTSCPIQTYTQSLEKHYRGLLSRLIDITFSMFGDKYEKTNFALLGLGSLASGIITPYSNVEFIVLVDSLNENQKADFLKFTRVLNLLIVMLGETPLCFAKPHFMNFEAYYDCIPRGFRVDERKRPGVYLEELGLVNTPDGILKHAFHPSRLVDTDERGHLTASFVLMSQIYPKSLFKPAALATAYHESYGKLLSGQAGYEESRSQYRTFLKGRILKDINELRNHARKLRNVKSDTVFDMKELMQPLMHLPKQLYIFLCLHGMPYQLTVKDTNWWTILGYLKEALDIAQAPSQTTDTTEKWSQCLGGLLTLSIKTQLLYHESGHQCTWKDIAADIEALSSDKDTLLQTVRQIIEISDVIYSDPQHIADELIAAQEAHNEHNNGGTHRMG